ncbi:zinc-ribbon and DUF3426 domain-containing protein [Uliginosibacterium sp. H3]|uniref:Zinc-ribbon and DUF3426 domain-containing protein n=1 Tax=Uliginosibacterium silvisoli TaxID=3114758 RepID=A0ABU6K1S0_9RHOO|nr:zinc-ribbon and DUF3426 domain-containing protein [Uliginosibacterium sp. H3]
MLITRCPHCETTFRVRMEQLNLRGGRVRCGHCHVPFSALESLEELPEDTPLQAPTPAQPTPPAAPAPVASPAPAPAPDTEFTSTWAAAENLGSENTTADDAADPIAAIDLPPTPLALHRNEPHEASHAQAEITQIDPPAQQNDAADLAFDLDGLDAKEAGGDSKEAPAPEPEFIEMGSAADDAEGDAAATASQDDALEGDTVIPAGEEGDEVPQLHTVFLDEEDIQPAVGMDPALAAAHSKTRLKLIFGNALLLVTGLLLATYVLRVELTRYYPGLRASLEQACQYLSCDVPYPKDADEVLLVGSDLTQATDPKGGYHLAVTVRNHAHYPVAWPQLEITLTDRFERALTRRVLEPKDWLPTNITQTAAFEAQGELTAQITLTSDAQVMGYRLGVFYR